MGVKFKFLIVFGGMIKLWIFFAWGGGGWLCGHHKFGLFGGLYILVLFLRSLYRIGIFSWDARLWGTYICAHAWIFFELCILIIHYIQTTKMYLSDKIVKNKA